MSALKVYWIGYGGSAYLAEQIRPTINSLGMTLTTIHEHRGNPEYPDADILWDRNTWKSHLEQADVIIIPMKWEDQPAKSNNRLTQCMSMGKPVVCSPLDAYVRIEKDHPGCCLFARNPEEWQDCLTRLRDDEELRRDMSIKAVEASKGYSLDSIGRKWVGVLKGLKDPVVDIVIPTYKNLQGLRLCLDSIKACTTDIRYNLLIVNNGTDEALHQYLNARGDIQYLKIGKSNFAQAVNVGIKAGKGDYVLILNDDVIASKGWLSEMVSSCTGDVGAVGPLSNCDKGWLHNFDIKVGGVDLLPGMNSFEQIEPIIPQIYEYRSPYADRPERDWVAFYCTLIPRSVLDKIGVLNEEYVNSGEDVDLCRRIKKFYRIIQNYKSFLFHFGAVSRKILEAENPGSYHEADRKTNEHLRHLWGKKSVMIYSGPSWERWSFKSMDEGGIGGSEIWVTWLSRELSKLDYRVTVFADTPETEMRDGDVLWLHYGQYPQWVNQHWTDYAILSRSTDPLRFPLRAGKIYVQIHDVWLLSDKNQTFLDKVDKFACLSQWHIDFASNYHNIPKDRMVLMANGIDFDRFDQIDVPRDPYRLIWGSSWDRGLDNVLYLWPFLKAQVPKANIHIYYGIHNWKESCLRKNDHAGLAKIAEYEEKVKQEGITVHGRVGQRELAKAYKSSSLLFYPGWFSETFFIGGVEAQRSGVPLLANKYAGVITTFGDSALLLGGNEDAWWPYSKEGREAFLKEAVELLTDNRKWKEWSEKGFENSNKYSWANVAKMWDSLFVDHKI